MGTGHPLTEEQVLYIRRHYKDTTNRALAALVGCARSTVCAIKKRYALSKSEEHAHLLAVQGGAASAEARGGIALAEYTPEMIERRTETYKRRFREEKARKAFGIPQKTRMKVARQPRRKCDHRAYLKRLGYIIDDENLIAYWTEETHRATVLEARPRQFYKFMPYEHQ